MLPLRDSLEIQGNILAGFNKDLQAFLFLQFPDDLREARRWLQLLVAGEPPLLAMTKPVAAFNQRFRALRAASGDDPESLRVTWVNLGLTHAGLVQLQPELERDLVRFAAFREGPAQRAELLGDSDPLSRPASWLFGGAANQPIHALLTVAADDRDDYYAQLDRQRAMLFRHGLRIVYEQFGATLPDRQRGREHFGFKDGISQPGVLGFDAIERNAAGEREKRGHPGTEMIRAGEFVLGYRRVDGSRLASPSWMRCGSFQVFRLLEQDVPGWWAQVTAQQAGLAADGPNTDLLAAKLVGRWRSGTPLAHAATQDNRATHDPRHDNDFTFEDDPEGLRTPLFAHIRKVYPRDDERFGDDSRRMIRRGIPYGRPFNPAAGRGYGLDATRGLCFNAFMADIEGQFEYVQRLFANSHTFPPGAEANGPDPVIGANDDPLHPVLLRHGEAEPARLGFRRFVHTRGAVYAFAPSLSAMRMLARDDC